MLIRNLDRSKGLCNGTRMVVESLHENFLQCKIISEKNKNYVAFLSRLDLTPSDTNLPFKLKRRQFSIIAGFGITINKSQGQTFDMVGIHLNEPVFAHGQLYVALSRSRDPQKIKVFLEHGRRQGVVDENIYYTENIVYREVFALGNFFKN